MSFYIQLDLELPFFTIVCNIVSAVIISLMEINMM